MADSDVKELLKGVLSCHLGLALMRKMIERGLVKGTDPAGSLTWTADAARLIGDDVKTILKEMFRK